MKNNKLTIWDNVKLVLSGKILPVKGFDYDETKEKNSVYTALKEKENEVLTNVLKQVLKREPTADDAKKLTKVLQSKHSNNYIIAYNELALGRIYMDTTQMKVRFIPFKEFTN